MPIRGTVYVWVNQEQFFCYTGILVWLQLNQERFQSLSGDIAVVAIELKAIFIAKRGYCILMQLNQAAALAGTPSKENCLDVAGGLLTKSSPK